MGYWYWRNLKNAWAVDESATNRFDLPEQGYLSGLKITVQQRNLLDLDNAYDDPYPVQRTTWRVLGNGNVDIVNAKAKFLEAINFWETGHMSRKLLWTLRNIDLSEELFIPFGRFMGDKEYGLILQKWGAGVQFEETNTWSTTYVTDTYQKYTIDGLFRKDPEPNLFAGGYFSKKNVATELSAARTQHPVKLPTRNKLKQIYFFTVPDYASNVMEITPFAAVSRIWLSIKSKEEKIWDNMLAGAIAYYMHQLYGRVARTEGLTGDTSATHYCNTKIAERQGTGACMFNTSAGFIVEDAATNLEQIFKAYTKNTAGTATGMQMYWNAQGICPHGLIPLLMQDPKGLDKDWLDAELNADVYVEFSEGTAAYSYAYIVLDELQKHPA